MQDIIAQDTKWTINNLPYLLTGNIQLTYGAPLTIESGVMVVGNNYKLQIFGNLVAVGADQLYYVGKLPPLQ